jgi:superfamily I DNA/RNA helicase
LDISAVKSVVQASYDRVLVDEYQDCDLVQHSLVCALSRLLPTIVFGDAMQGIFDFRGNPSVSWQQDVFPVFPLVGTLEEPMRWKETNPDLGAWIAKVRGKLERGEVIDLDDRPVAHVHCEDESDLAPLFEGMDSHGSSVAAIHCRRDTCDRLARFSMGAYQAIEDIAAKTLQEFASRWDQERSNPRRAELLKDFLKVLLTLKKRAEGDQDGEEDTVAWKAMEEAFEALTHSGREEDAISAINNLRRYSRTRVFRSELLRDTIRALEGVAGGRYATLAVGATIVRQRISTSGRWLPRRTVSTPLLLKGLEFDHVVVPDAAHFYREGDAAAKLFYVAISRARSTLVLASSKRQIQFPVPNI